MGTAKIFKSGLPKLFDLSMVACRPDDAGKAQEVISYFITGLKNQESDHVLQKIRLKVRAAHEENWKTLPSH